MFSHWVRDMLKGMLWALLVVACILFYTGVASRFIYVDF